MDLANTKVHKSLDEIRKINNKEFKFIGFTANEMKLIMSSFMIVFIVSFILQLFLLIVFDDDNATLVKYSFFFIPILMFLVRRTNKNIGEGTIQFIFKDKMTKRYKTERKYKKENSLFYTDLN